jgi:cytochrome c biogenesis protein CcdA
MLASINPLGERARGNRWGSTVAAFTAGALVVAAAIGAVLGGLGSLAHASAAARLTALGVAAVAAALVDLSRPGAVPSSSRQVDERWLGVYRGWVYGAGFGAQLGAGVVTVITSAMVYAWLVAAALAGSVLAGAVVGAAFALGRAVPFALVRRARRPEDLRARLRLVMGWARPGRVIAAGASLALGAGCLAARW